MLVWTVEFSYWLILVRSCFFDAGCLGHLIW